jgi:exonuclease SbcC
MRPLELRLRNFRSYFGEDSIFDLRHRGLVGVVGPIGSGKSSLLDAIAFALFGRTPTVAASTKTLIHQRADGATISLRFAVDDEVWEVTRALRRKGQSVHGLHRLAEDSPDAERIEEYVLEGEVNERIVELLGLEFDGFSRSIMLAQGRFAEFLRSRPAERDKVLKGVFGHDRIDLMRAAAKERAVSEATTVETLGVRLEAADALAGRIASSRETLTVDEARLELLRKAEAEFADFAERTAATTRVITRAESELVALAALAERIPAAAAVADIVEISKSANDSRQRIGAALAEAQAALAAADARLAELDPPAMRATIDEATRLEARIQQMELQRRAAVQRIELQVEAEEAATGTLGRTRADLEEALAVLEAASQAAAGVGEEHAAASRQLHAAQHNDMAGTLRAALAPGEPCPVCDQVVAAAPAVIDAPATATAEAVLAAAAERLDQAQRASLKATDGVAAARIAVGSVEAEAKAAANELRSAERQLKSIDGDLAGALEQLGDLCAGETPADLRKRLATAESAVAESRKRVDLARSEHDESIRSAQAADKELGTLRLSLAELATRLSLELGPTDEVDAVAAAVMAVRSAWTDSTETFTTAKVAAEREQAEIAAAERELRRELGIAGDFAAEVAQVQAATDLRRQQIEADQAELAKSGELRVARDAAGLRQKTFEALAGDLTDSKFVRYLLDEEKRELADLGSEHFERLSSGRYRFSADGDFHIVDLTSADAVRRADSLSGGETFLASLALALALAEMVARTGGRLDAFFLDEGFGSLDPEHLDLAMEGIEQLASGAANRLVLVVSHVAEMRHRIEDLIELDRDPVTGDTIVVHS